MFLKILKRLSGLLRREPRDSDAQFRLGTMFVNGLVCVVIMTTMLWYEQAAAQVIRAETNMAMMYAQGLGVSQNLEKAAFWFRKAARQYTCSIPNRPNVLDWEWR